MRHTLQSAQLTSGAYAQSFTALDPILERVSRGVYLDVFDIPAGELVHIDPMLSSYLADKGLDTMSRDPFDHVIVAYRDLSVLNATVGQGLNSRLVHQTNTRMTTSIQTLITELVPEGATYPQHKDDVYVQVSRTSGQPLGVLAEQATGVNAMRYIQRHVSLVAVIVPYKKYRDAIATQNSRTLRAINDVDYYVGVRKSL